MALCVREAGKSIPDAVSEVREAVDFLRYYAERAEEDFGKPQRLPGPTGESNELWLQGRGVFVCISPWNFPLAIFTGQVAAALAAGNAVLTKPAEQTSLIGAQAVRLMHEAGVPGAVLNFIPGRGSVVGQHAVADPRIAGVAFTGSTETAKTIHQTLANRDGIIPALIAETGGQNCHARGFLRAAGAGGAGCGGQFLQQRRPALLGLARAVRAGRDRRPRSSKCWPAIWMNSSSATPPGSPPTWAR